MKIILSAALASALIFGVSTSSEAAQKKRYVKRPHVTPSTEVDRNSGATARQRANSAAFERGGYYEAIPDQHVFGSRSWWIMKERELGGGGLP